jgi:hypothetical protein
VKPLLLALLLVLAVSACGKSAPQLYTRAASADCLAKAGHQPRSVAGTSDFVAQTATGGAFWVKLAANRVTVSFGETDADADNIDQAYRRFKSGNVGINDVLRRDGNAVMLWHVHPTDADIATVTGCLKT